MPATFAVKKSELRQRYLARRKTLSETDYQEKNQSIVARLFDYYNFESYHTVHCFVPSTRQREVDTWPIIRRLWQLPGVQVLAPRCDVDNNLTHHLLDSDTLLVNNHWGIPEPSPGSPTYPPEAIDFVLVPLLTFDQRGHRVGYGKGFYDRFLQSCRSDALKVGLSLFPPVDRIADADANDVRLDAVVTPERVWDWDKNQ